MILLYSIPNDDKAAFLRNYVKENNVNAVEISDETAGHTLGELFAGDHSEKKHPAEDLPIDPGIVFNAAEISHEDAIKMLTDLEEGGIYFGYQVMSDDSMNDITLGDVLIGHRDYSRFLEKLSFLQQMIDGAGALKENNYDPDRWSALKLAIANGNDFLDAVVSDTDSKFDEIDPKDIDGIIASLQTAMQKLLA